MPAKSFKLAHRSRWPGAFCAVNVRAILVAERIMAHYGDIHARQGEYAGPDGEVRSFDADVPEPPPRTHVFTNPVDGTEVRATLESTKTRCSREAASPSTGPSPTLNRVDASPPCGASLASLLRPALRPATSASVSLSSGAMSSECDLGWRYGRTLRSESALSRDVFPTVGGGYRRMRSDLEQPERVCCLSKGRAALPLSRS